MSPENTPTHLPDYQNFNNVISILDLPFSGSELHGMMCGYLCAGAASEGEAYLRALTSSKKDKSTRAAALAIFEVYTISQQQLGNFDFGFELLLPSEEESLMDRAQAFSEWCEGFTQSMAISGINAEQFQEEESQEALQHLQEFAQLDYESLEVNEEDEKALMEVSEYARMAVLRLYGDLKSSNSDHGSTKTTH
ncbi:UPF0149 family protein [Legionella micdadei]|uniref:YecA family protein n=1 Tax=Legionella micdadei TaxID=451 RepID=A0A098GBR7_LEGMI|nr:YecA family protein [Legionella micdadei]ARG96239.1 hypothetical protein B6N58_00205 [Legionella micdadei]ARG98997.1 hypothetical protein B6V88_00220 [Legionella micdadei]KTD29054.1 hypothetical protein Lmic_0974 [Legionella micdadei]NSL17262.1 UPF0149 family protein [Legionella micdadei]CEG59417.1 conserved protein of unknown function [Legionella micdadei]